MRYRMRRRSATLERDPVPTMKSRALRIVLIVLAVVLFAGYFAFTTFLYNPLEGDLDVDAGALVPRDVDFFVARADLDGAIAKFPRLEAQDRLDGNRGWRTWIESPEYAAFAKENRLEETLAELERVAGQLPLGLQPQELFGGEDLVLAGYFKGRDLAQADWAAYGRANWAGKLAAALAFHPGLVGLEKQGITAKVDEKVVALSGGGLPRTLHIGRIKDVVIVATRPDLVTKAHDLHRTAYMDSFFQSAAYADYIGNAKRSSERDEVELFVNARKLVENLALPNPWPDTKSQDFGPAFLGRVFQLASVKSLIGTASFDEGFQLDLHGELSSELLTTEQERIYRQRGFDRDTLENVAKMVPADASFFAYAHGTVGDLLRLTLASVEPALRTNLEDAFRNTGKYPTLEALVTELDGALRGRFALIVRPNDYPPDPDGPPHDATPMPAIALVLWTKNADQILALRELVGGQGAKFGLQGKAGQAGFYKNEEAGFETREYWSPFVPGTGVVATLNAGEITIVTNSFRMLGHVLKTQSQGTSKYPRLSEAPLFSALARSAQPEGNLFLWANPQTLAPLIRSRASYDALNSINIDWKAERARVEEKVLREKYPGERRGQLSPEVQAEVDAIVDPELEQIERKIKAEQVPALAGKQERLATYLAEARAIMTLVTLGPKAIDLAVRVVAPLEPEPE